MRSVRKNLCLLLCLCASAGTALGAGNQPVYIFLASTVSDHVNRGVTEARLRHLLPMLEKYHAQDPHVSASILFTGALSEDLERRNAGDHLLDYVRGFIDRKVIEPGYDGGEEPTWENRPFLDFSQALTPEDRWFVRSANAEKLLSEGRDPLTGAARPNAPGGLVKMQQVFGPAAYIRGVYLLMSNPHGPMPDIGFDSEIVNQIRRFNSSAVVQGITEINIGHVGTGNFRDWRDAFSKKISPDPDTCPELYWENNVLRSSESGKFDLHPFEAIDGVEKLKTVLSKLDRTRPRILHVELAGVSAWAKPYPRPDKPNLPIRYAYEHPDQPQYPPDLLRPASDVDAALAREDAVLKFLESEFFPANSGSRFVFASGLKQLTPAGWGYDLPMSGLRPAVENMLKTWGDSKVPPAFLRIGEHYLSQVDMFAVLAEALAQRNRTGKLPDAVHVSRAHAPIETLQQNQPVGEVSLQTLLRKATEIADLLRDDPQHERSWTPRPLNALPAQISADGLNLNPAQFLRLMAEALVAPASEVKLNSKPTDLLWGVEAGYYSRRLDSDLGDAWTYRPAPITARP